MKNRRLLIWMMMVCAGIAAGNVAASTGSERLPTDALVAGFERTVPGLLRDFNVPGTAVAVIRHGEVVWSQGFGVKDVASRAPVDAQTIFNVGSISKSLTAWGVMRLVEQGRIDLDRPVSDYLKRWKIPAAEFDAQKVTVRRLLSHTAGISIHDYHGSDPDVPLPPIEDSLAGKTGTGEVRLVAEPGSGFSYSGGGYSILQLMVEDVTGQDFASYMKEQVLVPLGMEHSEFGWSRSTREEAATPYDAFGEAIPSLRYNELSVAGLGTTVEDLAKFTAAGLAGPHGELPGRGVLRPETLLLMETPVAGTCWAEHDPFGPKPTYGLGYNVRPAQLEGKVGIGHGGSNRGWESLYQFVPDTGDGLVVMTNSSNGGAMIASLMGSWRKWAGGPDAPQPTIDVRPPLYGAYKAKGVDGMVERYRELRQSAAKPMEFAPEQLNSLGYELLRRGAVTDALEVFRLNVEQFPDSWLVHDSLGECWLKVGEKSRAIESYRKSVELNPWNQNGKDVLKQLEIAVE